MFVKKIKPAQKSEPSQGDIISLLSIQDNEEVQQEFLAPNGVVPGLQQEEIKVDLSDEIQSNFNLWGHKNNNDYEGNVDISWNSFAEKYCQKFLAPNGVVPGLQQEEKKVDLSDEIQSNFNQKGHNNNKIINKNISSNKQDLSANQQQMLKEEREMTDSQKEKEQLKQKIERLQQDIQTLKGALHDNQIQCPKLSEDKIVQKQQESIFSYSDSVNKDVPNSKN